MRKRLTSIWVRTVVATALVATALVASDPGGATSGTVDAAADANPQLALAEQLLAVANDESKPPAARAIDTARLAVEARRGDVKPELLPLLDQQARNLDTAERLLALSPAEDADNVDHLALGIEIAKVATEWQADTLGLDLESVVLPPAPDHDLPSEAAVAFIEGQGGTVTLDQRADLETLDGLDAPARDALTDFIDAFAVFSAATDLAYADADMDRIETLLDIMDDPEAVLDLVDSVQPDRLLADLGVDLSPVLAARNQLLDTVPALRDTLADPASPQQQSSSAAPIQVAPYLSIELGTATSNTYSQDFWLLLDVGGNDTYLNNAGGAQGAVSNPRPAAALVDLLGSDQYRSGRGHGINGGGALGSGALVDAAGNDLYSAGGTGTNGGGDIGAGYLLDILGNDTYQATDRGANGGGNFAGVGMLTDIAGDDSFSATRDGTNGGGDTAGVGFLVDGGALETSTVDTYSATDEATNGGSHLGGAGFLINVGLQSSTYAAGGIGVNGGSGASGGVPTGGAGFLVDFGGNDTYTGTDTGVNGGVSIIGSALLVDAGGSDVYSASNSGTNGGAVIGWAALLDLAGDDSYTGFNGAAFGGTGQLFDGQGNDRYTGANGNALAGTGLLADGGGTDRYRLNTSSSFVFDQTVVPKGLVGAQIDAPLPTVPTTIPPLPSTTVTTGPLPSTTITTIPLPPTTLPVPTTLPPPPTLPTTTTTTSTTTTSTTSTSTSTTTVPPTSTTTTTVPPPGGGANVGAGGFTGEVEFDPPGIPPLLTPCAPTTFSFEGEAEAFVLNTTIVGYVGPVSFSGSGGSGCEGLIGASGTLDLSASGLGPTGSTITCASLTGDYTRFLARAQINLTGDCTINGVNTTGILFSADVLVAPEAGTGITTPVLLAQFAGDFLVSPG